MTVSSFCILLVSADGSLISKLRAFQGLAALCDFLEQGFALGLLFGKLVLYLGTQVLVGP